MAPDADADAGLFRVSEGLCVRPRQTGPHDGVERDLGQSRESLGSSNQALVHLVHRDP